MPTRLGARLRGSVMLLVLAVLCAYLTWRTPRFATVENLLNVLRTVSMPGIIALGMTLVIVAGEIDLSVGSQVAFAGCLAAWICGALGRTPAAAAVGVALSLLAGAGCGAITGVLRVKVGVPSFITTLAWLTVLRGGAQLLNGGFTLTTFPRGYDWLGSGSLAGLPAPALVLAVVFAATWGLMNFTNFGRAVYAVGGNAEAARLSGVNTAGVKIAVLALVALLAALSGILQSARLNSGNPTTAVGLELEVISAVIIGGASLMGGSGTVGGTMLGVLFLGLLGNGMTLLDCGEYWQNVVRGGLILVAVLLNMASQRTA
jgi:ribose/xylose/arabinose/galactoside ABC-type transport system permease subunit